MKQLLFILSLLITSSLLEASSLRIEADKLQKSLNSYKILDTREENIYSQGHIQNAINFPVSLTYKNKTINGKLTDPLKMQKIIQSLGLKTDDKIDIYDDGSFFDASRLFWALEVYGFSNVKLLNAGYKQWHIKSFSTSTETPKIRKSNYIAIINNKRLATKFTTQIATKNPKHIIVDARGIDAYLGKKSAAKRYGHIPKAISIPATHNINYNKELSELKGDKALRELYKSINKDQKIIIYCAIGKIASTNYFAMRELGYDVSNYDASWREWGNDFALPIEVAPKD